MSERQIEVGEKKWKNPTEEGALAAVRWSQSQKGNDYTIFRGMHIVILLNKRNDRWQYITRRADSDDTVKWEWHGKYDTKDKAKAAALLSLRPRREPVSTEDESECPMEEDMKKTKKTTTKSQSSLPTTKMKRKILMSEPDT